MRLAINKENTQKRIKTSSNERIKTIRSENMSSQHLDKKEMRCIINIREK